MFQAARLKLTAWYITMLMLISIIFSVVIFNIVSHQIEGLIRMQNERIRHFQEAMLNGENLPPPPKNSPPLLSTQDLYNQEEQLFITLIIVNGIILIIAGGAAYFLAGRTLRPIKVMIDEQNQFISHASHQLRTPIAAMRIDIEGGLLEKHITDNRAREIANSNLEELGSLQALTNNLLQLAQLPHNISKNYKEKVSLTECIESACKKVTVLAKKKQISISSNVEEVLIRGDESSLREAFVTLLENAIKYSPEKTKVSIISKKDKNSIKVMVTDQGIGIAESDLPHIFNRFYRASQAYPQEGFGLGLSIAKRIIQTHNGSIVVISTENKGTTFTISLPLTVS
jgi:two-component system sensor histidine kinase CiaH